jgi:hypothetical protein
MRHRDCRFILAGKGLLPQSSPSAAPTHLQVLRRGGKRNSSSQFLRKKLRCVVLGEDASTRNLRFFNE